jgi:hypothetical protein
MVLNDDICHLPAMNPSDGNFIDELFGSDALGVDSDGGLSSGSE